MPDAPKPLSTIERMRQAAKNAPPKPPPPAVVLQPSQKTKEKEAKKIVLVKSVKYPKCGHVCPVKSLNSGYCHRCAMKNKAKRNERSQNKKHAGFDFNADMGGSKPGRLPAQTKKQVLWTGELWEGWMQADPANLKQITVTCKAETERGCFTKLHAKYMKELAKQRKLPKADKKEDKEQDQKPEEKASE